MELPKVLADPLNDLPHLSGVGGGGLQNSDLRSPGLQSPETPNGLAHRIILSMALKPGRPLLARWKCGLIEQDEASLRLCRQVFREQQTHFS
jgi:hypothetical protein